MAKRDPHDILGVERGASQPSIKAAWRRLARRHHPDLTGDDPAASRVATRQMAEINDAYAALTREDGGPPGSHARHGAPRDGTPGAAARSGRGGPPRPKPSRPVTGRLDTTETFRPRNQTSSRGVATSLPGQPPLRADRVRSEPLRSSDPNGPLHRSRVRDFRRPRPPRLAAAAAMVIGFGKFHGHTLGEIAAFEPTYIDWLVRTVTRDPELVAAARVVQADLDRRRVLRRPRPATASAGPSA